MGIDQQKGDAALLPISTFYVNFPFKVDIAKTSITLEDIQGTEVVKIISPRWVPPPEAKSIQTMLVKQQPKQSLPPST